MVLNIMFFHRFLLIGYSFLLGYNLSFTQAVLPLQITDSIEIVWESPNRNISLIGIYKVGPHFWARFDSYDKSDKIDTTPDYIYADLPNFTIDLVNDKKQHYGFRPPHEVATFFKINNGRYSPNDYRYLNVDLSRYIYPYKNGFMQPKYFGMSTLLYFDTIAKSVHTVGHIRQKNTFIRPQGSPYHYGQCIGRQGDKVLYSRQKSNSPLHADMRTLTKALHKSYREPLFLLYNHKKGAIAKVFGYYPASYQASPNGFLPNKHYNFYWDTLSHKVYVSFASSDSIWIYDMHSNEKKVISIPTKNIRSNKLCQAVKEAASYWYLKPFRDLLSDTYDAIIVVDTTIFRTYYTGYDSTDLKAINPYKKALASALTTDSEEKKYTDIWYNKAMNKPMYLQQISAGGHLEYTFSLPKSVNRFLGYNEKREEYYFWQQKGLSDRQSPNTISAKIYILKKRR